MGLLKWLLDLSPPVLIGVVMFAMLNFIVPEKFIAKLNIAKLEQQTAKRMWLVMIAAISLLAAILIVDLYNSGLKRFYDDYMRKKHFEELIAEKITKDEVVILKHFLDKQGLTLCTYGHNRKYKRSALKTLERDGIIYLMDTNKKEGFPCYSIERWAYFHLRKHPELLNQLHNTSLEPSG